MNSRAGSGKGVSSARIEGSTCPCGLIRGRSLAAANSSRAIDRWVGSGGNSTSGFVDIRLLIGRKVEEVGDSDRTAGRERGVAGETDQQRGGTVTLGGS